MPSIADQIRAKLTRAKDHIEDLRLALGEFVQTNPYAVAFKEDVGSGKRIYYVSKADPLPDMLAPIAADAIQNIRAPLDHIIYQLMLAGGASNAALKKAEYPIRDLAAHYPSARGGIAKYLRPELIDAIDATEPYKGGKGHALWQLNALKNTDTHHLLIAAAAISSGVDVSGTLQNMFRSNPRLRDIVVPPIFIRPAECASR